MSRRVGSHFRYVGHDRSQHQQRPRRLNENNSSDNTIDNDDNNATDATRPTTTATTITTFGKIIEKIAGDGQAGDGDRNEFEPIIKKQTTGSNNISNLYR